MKCPKVALVTVACLISLVSLSACGSEPSDNRSTLDDTSTDTVIFQQRSVPLPPIYVRPQVPSYTPQPIQPAQPEASGWDSNVGSGMDAVVDRSYQNGLDILHDFQQEAQSPASTPSSVDAEIARQQAINNQLDNQSHYGNVRDYQLRSIQQSQDFLNHSNAKSYDPAGAP